MEYKEWNGNAWNQSGNAGYLGENERNAGNQGGDAGNQNWNLVIAVEITKNSNENDKLKEWREVRLIENEHIRKILVSYFWSGSFLVSFGCISHDVFLFLLLILNR